MAYSYKFQKILQLREREKEETQTLYNESLKQFEKAAEKLYALLKKKETLIDFQEAKMVSGFSIQEIQHYQLFVSNLEQTISYQQQVVINARNKMQWHEQQLQEKNIEVKKYEKIKEKDFERFKESLLEEENKQMDEISAIQFMNRGN
ncbi:flagellar export protein FliJ [Bacillus badius]|uniref:Flagellar FliJ protein n=1 Tax=Bacillus badius TaxID=1455 RepID=A0ABR5B0S7_BACBA|nr:flagellar export protein FliJ [Bacillus badius]KIL73572.1 Flagellar protein FliJ [Bacillus badius]KIL80579.1 Flagellar protein FliJ [Bacillus badius]KZO01665.1 flagellar biosynthesis chaperone [Bacillus badius]KZR57379.1 flagellar biosynthesis chaperone [Bacillus badius]MED0667322.1 flagellar export protein FliJ [Bacillus badius]